MTNSGLSNVCGCGMVRVRGMTLYYQAQTEDSNNHSLTIFRISRARLCRIVNLPIHQKSLVDNFDFSALIGGEAGIRKSHIRLDARRSTLSKILCVNSPTNKSLEIPFPFPVFPILQSVVKNLAAIKSHEHRTQCGVYRL
jgi:hypothetical protein